jgi:hypothetical protein
LLSLARLAPSSASRFQSARRSWVPRFSASTRLRSRRLLRLRTLSASALSPGANASSNSMACDWRCSSSVKRLLKPRSQAWLPWPGFQSRLKAAPTRSRVIS